MAIVDEEPPVPASPREAANDRESHKGLRDVFIISLEFIEEFQKLKGL